jgi:Protein of unknown function (DUF2752)
VSVAAPLDRRPRRERVAPPVLLAAGVLLVSVLLHLRDPHRSGSWGYCPWFLLTGTYCPGCGGLRAVSDLTRGDVAAAASSNLLLVASLPLVALWWGRTLLDRWRGVGRALPLPRVVAGCAGFAVVAVVFCVARNTGPGAWLAP